MKLTKNSVFLHYFSKFMGILLFVLKYMFISLILKMINGFPHQKISWTVPLITALLGCFLQELLKHGTHFLQKVSQNMGLFFKNFRVFPRQTLENCKKCASGHPFCQRTLKIGRVLRLNGQKSFQTKLSSVAVWESSVVKVWHLKTIFSKIKALSVQWHCIFYAANQGSIFLPVLTGEFPWGPASCIMRRSGGPVDFWDTRYS